MHSQLPDFLKEDFWFDLFRVAHALRSLLRPPHPDGLNRTQGAVLAMLWSAADGLTASDLRTQLGITAPSMSAALAEMERAGWVMRRPNPEDARSQLVFLTDDGRTMVEVFRAHVAAVQAHALEGITEAEVDALRDTLQRIYRNLEGEAGDCEPPPWIKRGREHQQGD